MEREWYWRGGLIAVITLWFVYLLVPSYYYFKLPPDQRNDKEIFEKTLPKWAPKNHLNLGLDLQGGIHLVMEVDVDAAMTAKLNNRASELQDRLEKKGLTGTKAKVVNKDQIAITTPPGKAGDAEKELSDYFNDMSFVSSSGDTLTYEFKPEAVKSLKDGAVEQSIKAIRNRVDKFGVTEPTINRRGSNHILVQLPGFKDPEQAKELIGKTAQLEFRIVNDEDRTTLPAAATDLPPGIKLVSNRGPPYLRSSDQKLLQDYVNNHLKDKGPAGYVFMVGADESDPHSSAFRTYLVTDKPGITGEYLTDARVQYDNQGVGNAPEVGFTFNKVGADLLAKLTGDNVGKGMAIVLDGFITSAPNIRSKIPDGSGRITLGNNLTRDVMQEAQNLSLVLKAGALPAPVTIAEQRSVGASLGPELIKSGATAVIVGTLLVICFMMLYYRLSGVVADVALLLNAILILGSLTLFGAALSLPGIAGIVLTLGVAVDANVIINERIREELRAGKTPRTALALGYDKAFAAIFDSNLTTVISGVVLLQYGTGPIRGFAVTLIIGVTASMFTAIVVTRWIMDYFVAKRPERLSV
jgi:preprotein translocase subunit SecD